MACPSHSQQDPKLRDLFEFVAQFWTPKPKKKKTSETLEFEEAAEDEGDEEDEEGLQEETKGCQVSGVLLDAAEGGKGKGSGSVESGQEQLREDNSGSPKIPDFGLMRRMGLSPNTPVAPAYVQAAEHVDQTAAPEAPRPSECDECDVEARLADIERSD